MVDEFQETLEANWRRRMAVSVAASLITHSIRDLFPFSPGGLELAICEGWSLFDSLQSLPPAELESFLFSIPSMDLIMMGLSRDPASFQLYAKELTHNFPLPEVLDRVTQALPQHGKILAAHPEWLDVEKKKLLSLLG